MAMPSRRDEALEFSRLVHRVDIETLSKIEVVNARAGRCSLMRRWCSNTCPHGKPSQVVFSALGVREGLLYSLLKQKDKEKDALIEAARGLNVLRSRSPHHGEELIDWTDRFMASSGLDETAEERRLRHAACLLADIGWRAHPDYRGEQSINIIAHGGFIAIDHPGRAYLALAVFYRHVGLVRTTSCRRGCANSPRRACSTGRAFWAQRCGWPTLCPRRSPACCRRRRSRWSGSGWRCIFPVNSRRSAGERVLSRLRSLARLIGREPVLLMG